MAPSAVLAVLGIVLLGAYLLETLFHRTHIPDQLFLIAAGLVFGHAFGWAQRGGLEGADRLFTEAALVVILFHGGSALDLRELIRSLGSAASLTAATFGSAVLVILVIVHFGFGQPWSTALLLGTMLGGTGPTVIVPMVRALGLGESTAAALTVESGLSDVLCIVVALATISAVKEGTVEVGATVVHAIVELGVTVAVGALAAGGWTLLRAQLERHVRKDHLGTMAVLFALVGLADLFHLSGPMAALVFGLVLANLSGVPGLRRLRPEGAPALNPEERYFIHELSFMLKTFFFLYLGVIIRVGAWQAAVCAICIMALLHALRPPIVRLCLPRTLPRRDVATAAALVPKGTVAVVLARRVAHEGIPGAAFLGNVALPAVVLSIVSAATLVIVLRYVDAGKLFGGLFDGYAAQGTPRAAPPVAPGSATG